jgi:hypothetical protein
MSLVFPKKTAAAKSKGGLSRANGSRLVGSTTVT